MRHQAVLIGIVHVVQLQVRIGLEQTAAGLAAEVERLPGVAPVAELTAKSTRGYKRGAQPTGRATPGTLARAAAAATFIADLRSAYCISPGHSRIRQNDDVNVGAAVSTLLCTSGTARTVLALERRIPGSWMTAVERPTSREDWPWSC